ncbi:MAG: hemerythrin domain-containing protein [Candidatus Marinimicrobia bacterium]|nr:hemerythrin domain-containing protein [Candidatus Neomarinimicrobiota bacterium]
MKREKFIEILSWEHHDGLVIALRLERGLEKGADINSMKDYILNKWDTLLKDHFTSEELNLVQAIQYEEPDSEPIEQMLSEHTAMTALVENIKNNNSQELIKEFYMALRNHIKFEENTLFPYVESTLDKALKERIQQCLSINYTKADKDWPVKFWE